ncbi:MAG TPA: hypothetical protein PLC42_07165 [Parachlamydiaceae bacterium]|nr:hypothetical protein [Parachlamydiaceae bacterium]
MEKFLGLIIVASFIAIPAQEEPISLKKLSPEDEYYSCPCKNRKRGGNA